MLRENSYAAVFKKIEDFTFPEVRKSTQGKFAQLGNAAGITIYGESVRKGF